MKKNIHKLMYILGTVFLLLGTIMSTVMSVVTASTVSASSKMRVSRNAQSLKHVAANSYCNSETIRSCVSSSSVKAAENSSASVVQAKSSSTAVSSQSSQASSSMSQSSS